MQAYDVARVLLGLAGILGWGLARRTPDHWPAVLALTMLLWIDTGMLLGNGHVHKLLLAALFLAAYAIQAGLALRVLLRVSVKPAIVGWALGVYTLTLRWELARPVYTITFAAALVLQMIATGVYARQNPRALPNSSQGISILLSLSAVAEMTGPWLAGQPDLDWAQGGKVAALTWFTILTWEVYKWMVLARR